LKALKKIVELNMSASKAALAESGENAKALLSVKDAQELLALQSSLLQPLAEKTAAYSRHLYEIATGTTGEFTKASGKPSCRSTTETRWHDRLRSQERTRR
jgi:phasin family protein